MLNQYLTLISHRASGQLQTPAHFMRKFMMEHPTYRQDSAVSPEAAYDLMKHCKRLTEGKVSEPGLYGKLWPRCNKSPIQRRALHPDVPHIAPDFVPVRAKGTLTSAPPKPNPNTPTMPNKAHWDAIDSDHGCPPNEAPDQPHTGAPYTMMRYRMIKFLKDILAEMRHFHPQYSSLGGPTICNHTYMAVIALFHLGGLRGRTGRALCGLGGRTASP